jgi:8-oxo-dGTP pyrophosphatase MutT (NUDIX family)
MSQQRPKKNPKSAVRVQYGVLPYRWNKEEGLQILLVTSRETHRWIVPKGWPIKGLRPAKSAAREAYEEAGVRGSVKARSIAKFVYDKHLSDPDVVVSCEVSFLPCWLGGERKNGPKKANARCSGYRQQMQYIAPETWVSKMLLRSSRMGKF